MSYATFFIEGPTTKRKVQFSQSVYDRFKSLVTIFGSVVFSGRGIIHSVEQHKTFDFIKKS